MGQVSKVLRSVEMGAGRRGFAHWCAGCNTMHAIATEGPRPLWTFNGDVDRPTFLPSVKVVTPAQLADGEFPATREEVCHYFIEAGVIRYCADSTHEFAGVNVEISPVALGGGES